MGKKLYIGIEGKARKIKKMYIGVDGKARKVKKMYMGALATVLACNIYAGTGDMVAGTTALTSGTIYVMYE